MLVGTSGKGERGTETDYLHGANHAVNPEDVSKSSERDRRSKNYYILHPQVTTYEHYIHM